MPGRRPSAARAGSGAAVSFAAPRLGQHLGAEELIEFLPAHQLLLQDEVVYSRTGRERVLGDLGGARIADEGRERSDERGRFVEQAPRALAVGGDAEHAALTEG